MRSEYPMLSNDLTGIYLVEDEYAKFNINGFNPLSGCIEFFIDPDWQKSTNCNTCKDTRSHTIFRFVNSDGYLLEALMTVDGLSIFLSDGINVLHHMDDSGESIDSGISNHFAISWDFISNSATVLDIYVNNRLSSSFSSSSVPNTFNLKYSLCYYQELR